MTEPTQHDNQDLQLEILLQSRRTTHAVRAIARFVLLIVTYQVLAGVLIGGGLILSSNELGPMMVLSGLVLVVVGLIHSLSASWEEFGKSNRIAGKAVSATNAQGGEYSHRLFDGECDCSENEIAKSGTDFLGSVQYCLGCSRALPKGEPQGNEPPRDEHGLLEGQCSCTKWERFGSIETRNGVTYCSRCERAVAQ